MEPVLPKPSEVLPNNPVPVVLPKRLVVPVPVPNAVPNPGLFWVPNRLPVFVAPNVPRVPVKICFLEYFLENSTNYHLLSMHLYTIHIYFHVYNNMDLIEIRENTETNQDKSSRAWDRNQLKLRILLIKQETIQYLSVLP